MTKCKNVSSVSRNTTNLSDDYLEGLRSFNVVFMTTLVHTI